MKRKRVGAEKLCGVYLIINRINKKVYVGSSKDIYGRWVQHKNHLSKNKHCNKHLQCAWNKYGEESFDFKIIQLCDKKALFENEQKWYDYYNSGNADFGYNISGIAKCPSFHVTEESLKLGKHAITYNQFNDIINFLENTKISIPKIAKKVGVSERIIYQIYFKQQYTELTKHCNFVKRKYGNHGILFESQVIEIINRLKNNEYMTDIANDYGISVSTVYDIRHHKTWTYLTEDIVFDDISKKKKPSKKSVDIYDLYGNLIENMESARAVENKYGIPFRNVSQLCHGDKRQSHGYICRFSGDDFYKYDVLRKNGERCALR